MANKQIKYGIGFDVDKTSLQEVKMELKNISNLTLGKLKLIDKNATVKDLQSIKKDAEVVGNALEKSFNPKLNTINLESFNKVLKNSKRNIKDIEESFSRVGSQGKIAFRNMTAELFTTQKAVKQTSNLIDSMAKTLFNTIKWSLASGAINKVTGAINSAWGYTKSLDKSLNDIRIVTEKSAADMDKFAIKANKAAKALGAATTAYTKASLIYYQQGLSEEDVQARTDVTIKAANVTGQSAAEVSEQLTAVWNGYKVVAEEAELYIDKLSAVAATTAADLEELSEGMSKVASGANAMGVDIDQLTAQLSTIVSVTRQDASAVGTALKTIFARMGDLKVDGVDEFGVSLGDVSGTLKKVGIEVLDQQGNLRDMGIVMEEVASKWGTWTEAQQQAIAVAMAGKRQYNNLLALFENWDMYESALTTSRTSEGTLQKQQDIYMDSLEAKLQKLSTSGEKIYKSLFDSESMKDFLDVLSVAMDGLSNFIDGIGGGGTLLLGITSTLGKHLSGDIAIGIGQIAHNFGVLKSNALQTKAEMMIMSEYQDVSEEAIKKMVALKQEQLKADEYLTEEEKERYEFLIKQTAELANQKDLLKQQKLNLDEFYTDNVTNKDFLHDKKTGQFLPRTTWEEKGAVLENKANVLADDLDTFKVQDPTKKLLGYQKERFSLSTRGGDTEQIDNKILKMADEEAQRAADLVNSNKLTQESYADLSNAIDDYLDAKKKGEKVDQAAIKLAKTHKKALEDSAKAYKNAGEEAKGLAKKEDDLTDKMAEVNAVSAEMTKAVNFKAIVKGTTDFISSAGQAATAVLSIKSAIDSLNNSDLSDGEKILQFISGIAMSAPMAISAIKGIATAFGFQNIAIGKNATLLKLAHEVSEAKNKDDEKSALINFMLAKSTDLVEDELKDLNTEELKKIAIDKGMMSSNGELIISNGVLAGSFKTLGAAIKSAIWPLLLISIAIVAVLAIVNAVKQANEAKQTGKATKKAEAELQKIKEAAANATEKVKTLKDELSSLTDSFDKYEDGLLAIDKMVKGTQEWNDAVLDLNNSVLDLMNKYPELAQYVSADENGNLSISQEGQDFLTEKKREELNTAQRNSIVAQIGVLNANTAKEQAKLKDAIEDDENIRANSNLITVFDENGEYKNYDTFTNISDYFASDEFTQKLVEEQKENPDLFVGATDEEGKAVKDSEYFNFIQDELATEFGLAGESNAFYSEMIANALAENVSAAESSVAAMKAQTAATQALNRSYLTKLAEEKGISDAETFANVSLSDLNNSTKIRSTDEIIKDYNKTNYDAKKDSRAVTNKVNGWIEKVYGKGFGKLSTSDLDGVRTLDDFKKRTFTIGGLKITGEELIQGAAYKDYEKAIEAATQKNQQILDSLEKKGLDTHYAYFMGDNSAEEWVGQTLGQTEKLFAGADAVDGVDKKAIEDAIFAMQNKIKKAIEDVSVAGRSPITLNDIFNIDDLSNFTEEDLQKLRNNFASAYYQAGDAGVEALKKAFILANNDPELIEQINNLAEGVNLSSSEGVSQFIEGLKEIGLVVNFTDQTWTNLFDNINSGLKLALSGINNLRNAFGFLASEIRNIKIGDVIDEETFNKLVSLNPAASDYFVKTSTGYVATTSGIDIEQASKNKFNFTTNDIDKVLTNAIDIANSNNIARISSNQLTTSQDLKQFRTQLANNSAIFTALGVSESQLNNLWEQYLSTESTTEQKEQAENRIQEVYKDAQDFVGKVQLGEISINDLKRTLAVDFADSWTEAQKYIKETDGSAYSDAQKYWRTQYLTELGVESANLFKSLEMDSLEAQVKRVRKLEQDRYSNLEKNIKKLDTELNSAFGSKRLNILDQIIEKEQKSIEIAEERAVNAKMNAETLVNAYAINNGINPNIIDITFLQNQQLNFAEDSSAYKELEYIINALELVEDTAQEVLDKTQEKIDSEFEKIDAKVEIHLDLTNAIRDWKDFKIKYVDRDGIDLFRDLNANETVEIAKNNYDTYLTDFLNSLNTLKNISTIDENGNIIPIVGTNLEEFNKHLESAKENYQLMYDSAKEMLDAYSSYQEEIMSFYDEQIEKLSEINSLYSSSAELLKLVGGDAGRYVGLLRNNAELNRKLALEQLAAAQNAFNTDYDIATPEQKKILEENLNNAATAAINASREVADAALEEFRISFSSSIDAIFKENNGLQGFSEAWERELYFDERYLDETNKIYSVTELERKIQKSIDETDSYSAQKKLNALKEQELNLLKQKDKLTQDDLDRANARYELELKRIALEEAQQTATKMKLVRDASGNYSYQYVADQDLVAQAEEEYSAAENSLYNLNKDQEKSLIGDLMGKYQEAMDAIGSAQTKEEKEALYEHYFGKDGVIELLKADLAAIGIEGANTDTYTSKYQATIEKLMSVNKDGSLESIFNELINGNEEKGLPGFSSTVEILGDILDDTLGEEGPLITAIKDLSEKIAKPNMKGQYFDYITAEENATEILKNLFGEDGKGGIASALGTNADSIVELLTAKISTLATDANTIAIEANTNAINSLTQAIVLVQDLANDNTKNGNVEGWSLKDGYYSQSAEIT